MDNQSTIPSQLGPVQTIPAPLTSASGRSEPESGSAEGSGLMIKLVFAALAVALLAYLMG